MMLRPYAQSATTDAYLSALGQEINNGQLSIGKGLKVRKHGNGTILEADSVRVPDGMIWRGIYDFTQQYQPNDVVFVDPTLTYTDQNGNPLPFNNPLPTGSESGSLPNLCAGLFVCVTIVPPSQANSNVLDDVIVPEYTSMGWGIPNTLADNFRHYDLNVYYPICPTIPSSSIVYVSDPNYVVTANNTFWQPLAPMMTASLCVGGQGSIQGWIYWFPSASFDLLQLPYTGSGS